jgi:hypothetical protein
MFSSFGNMFGRKAPMKGGPLLAEPPSARPVTTNGNLSAQTYTRVFRWRLPDGHTASPASVEIVGSFTHWQKVPLKRDSELDAWHVTIHHIPGNRTHHYMLLVDGEPIYDKNAAGLAVPHGPQEERYQLQTERGGRVFMMYSQTK